jgi:hypothetical protein
MTVRVTLISDALLVCEVEAANEFTTNATSGAGLVADLYDKDPNNGGVRLATFGHVLYVEKIQDEGVQACRCSTPKSHHLKNDHNGPDNPQYINGG